MVTAFTICSNNYLAQAKTLGDSYTSNNANDTFCIVLVDRKSMSINYQDIPYAIIEIESIGILDFEGMAERYSIVELNTAVKPFCFQYFFSKTEENHNVIYLDPDIFVYKSFNELKLLLTNNDIVITPHITTPVPDDKQQQEEDYLNAGLYNLGFIAIKNSDIGRKMVFWWAEKLRFKAFIDFSRGLFTDQIWINFVPIYFSNVHVFINPGYNMAYWNLHERSLRWLEESYMVNKLFPLVFYHFSGYSPLQPFILSKYQTRYSIDEPPLLYELFNEYSRNLFLNGFDQHRNEKCFFQKSDNEKNSQKSSKISFMRKLYKYLISSNYLNHRYFIL